MDDEKVEQERSCKQERAQDGEQGRDGEGQPVGLRDGLIGGSGHDRAVGPGSSSAGGLAVGCPTEDRRPIRGSYSEGPPRAPKEGPEMDRAATGEASPSISNPDRQTKGCADESRLRMTGLASRAPTDLVLDLPRGGNARMGATLVALWGGVFCFFVFAVLTLPGGDLATDISIVVFFGAIEVVLFWWYWKNRGPKRLVADDWGIRVYMAGKPQREIPWTEMMKIQHGVLAMGDVPIVRYGVGPGYQRDRSGQLHFHYLLIRGNTGPPIRLVEGAGFRTQPGMIAQASAVLAEMARARGVAVIQKDTMRGWD